jgi:PAS domain S-box-containing protein
MAAEHTLSVNRHVRTPVSDRERRLLHQVAAERRRRAAAESAAQQWQDWFRCFLDHAPMPAFIRDELGRHVYGNLSWAGQFNRPLEELLERTNWELFPRETALVFETSDQAARLRGGVRGALETGLAPDGRRRWWKVFKFPLPEPSGSTWIGGLALDVTDLLLTQSRLREFENDLASGRLAPGAARGDASQLAKLPPRLCQVLELLAAGWTLKETAARLGISPKTAEAHRSKLLRRLGVQNIVEAVRLRLGDAAATTRESHSLER